MKRMLLFTVLTMFCGTVGYSQETMMKGEPDKTAMTKIVSAEDASKAALNVGAKMPAFTLKDDTGKSVSSANLLSQSNLVVVFYRGSWCPFCNLYLRKLQQNMTAIKENGGNLVAISVENPDNSLAIAKKNELDFTVLSDPNLEVARQFGIVYQLPAVTDEAYKTKYNLNIAKHNEMAKPELPLSATYVVNQTGKIVYAYLEPDYKKRAEPQVIIETLSKIKAMAMNK
jgi:peroxiredoxin